MQIKIKKTIEKMKKIKKDKCVCGSNKFYLLIEIGREKRYATIICNKCNKKTEITTANKKINKDGFIEVAKLTKIEDGNDNFQYITYEEKNYHITKIKTKTIGGKNANKN